MISISPLRLTKRSTEKKKRRGGGEGRGGEGEGEGRIPKGRQIRKFKHAQILILAKCHLMAQYLSTEINSVSFGRFSSKINSVLTTYSSYCCMKRLASWLLPWMECCLLQLVPVRLSILFKLVRLHGKETEWKTGADRRSRVMVNFSRKLTHIWLKVAFWSVVWNKSLPTNLDHFGNCKWENRENIYEKTFFLAFWCRQRQ